MGSKVAQNTLMSQAITMRSDTKLVLECLDRPDLSYHPRFRGSTDPPYFARFVVLTMGRSLYSSSIDPAKKQSATHFREYVHFS